MEWYSILSGLIGGVSIWEGIKFIIFRKHARAKESAGVMDATAGTLKSYGQIIDKQAERINKLTETTLDLSSEILKLKGTQEQAKYVISENERKIKGMQALFSIEVGKKKAAERLICFVENCTVRKPKLGTYKTETKEYEH